MRHLFRRQHHIDIHRRLSLALKSVEHERYSNFFDLIPPYRHPVPKCTSLIDILIEDSTGIGTVVLCFFGDWFRLTEREKSSRKLVGNNRIRTRAMSSSSFSIIFLLILMMMMYQFICHRHLWSSCSMATFPPVFPIVSYLASVWMRVLCVGTIEGADRWHNRSQRDIRCCHCDDVIRWRAVGRSRNEIETQRDG